MIVDPRRRAATAAAWIVAAVVGSGSWAAQEPAPKPDAGAPKPSAKKGDPARPKARAKARRRARRDDPPGFYMGRPIADVMSWQGAEWLFRETRIQEEQPEAMLDALKIPRGATVADVGAGAGYHSIRMARRVGPKGVVYAADVQPEMLRMLRDNARLAGVANIKTIRCTQTDSGLPEGAVDLILMVDVYHECSDPEAVLKGFLGSLKPGGRLVLVEFRGEDPEVPIKPEHKMTLAQVRREVEPQGFAFRESLEFLPWQHVIIFEKPERRRDTGTGKGDAASPPSASGGTERP